MKAIRRREQEPADASISTPIFLRIHFPCHKPVGNKYHYKYLQTYQQRQRWQCSTVFIFVVIKFAVGSHWYISLRTLFCPLSSVSWFPCESPLFRVTDTHACMVVFHYKNVSHEFIVCSQCERVYPVPHLRGRIRRHLRLGKSSWRLFFLRSNEKKYINIRQSSNARAN